MSMMEALNATMEQVLNQRVKREADAYYKRLNEVQQAIALPPSYDYPLGFGPAFHIESEKLKGQLKEIESAKMLRIIRDLLLNEEV